MTIEGKRITKKVTINIVARTKAVDAKPFTKISTNLVVATLSQHSDKTSKETPTANNTIIECIRWTQL